jgi:hypothetical protein
MNNVLEIIAMSTPCGSRVMSGNVTKGAVIRCGGSWYLATEDTAITGTASPYVQLTPNVDGSELNAAYVETLTGVSFNKIYNTWSDVQGRVYLFDEAYAYAWGQIPAMNTIEAWRPANTNLAKLLTAGIGNGKWRSLAETAYISEYFASGIPVVKAVTGTEDKPELNKYSAQVTHGTRLIGGGDEDSLYTVEFTSSQPVVFSGFDILYENDAPAGGGGGCRVRVYKYGNPTPIADVEDSGSLVIPVDADDVSLGTTPVGFVLKYKEYGASDWRGPWRVRIRYRVAPATILEGEITPMELACGDVITVNTQVAAG